MAIDSRINAGAPFSPDGALVLNGEAHTVQRGATVSLTVGATVTTPPVQLPALTASVVLVQCLASTPATAWVLDTSTAPSAKMPVVYSTAGAGGSLGDNLCQPGILQTIILTAAQQALLAAGNLYLSAVSSGAGTISLSFAMQA